jgi:WD40 repeat protein
MPNHIHLICSQEDGKLSSVIGDMKQFTSNQISKKLEEDGRLTWLAAMKRTSGKNGCVKVWDADTEHLLHQLDGQVSFPFRLLTLSNYQLVSAHASGTIRLWDLQTGECSRLWNALNGQFVYDPMELADGRLATTGMDDKIKIWE